jgi:hypothetical protein
VLFLGYVEEYFALVVGIRPARKTQRKFFVVIKGICISEEITKAFFVCRNNQECASPVTLERQMGVKIYVSVIWVNIGYILLGLYGQVCRNVV